MLIEKRPCMNCHQSVASVKLTRLVKGGVEELYLCQKCAAEKSPYQNKGSLQKVGNLESVLAGILGPGAQEAAARPTAASGITCSTCGMPYSNYKQTLILGCSDCYTSFEQHLVKDLQRFHGKVEHRGRVPHGEVSAVRNHRSAQELRRRLADAVKSENFELAARLRDELKAAEATLEPETNETAET